MIAALHEGFHDACLRQLLRLDADEGLPLIPRVIVGIVRCNGVDQAAAGSDSVKQHHAVGPVATEWRGGDRVVDFCRGDVLQTGNGVRGIQRPGGMRQDCLTTAFDDAVDCRLRAQARPVQLPHALVHADADNVDDLVDQEKIHLNARDDQHILIIMRLSRSLPVICHGDKIIAQPLVTLFSVLRGQGSVAVLSMQMQVPF